MCVDAILFYPKKWNSFIFPTTYYYYCTGGSGTLLMYIERERVGNPVHLKCSFKNTTLSGYNLRNSIRLSMDVAVLRHAW